MTCALHPRLPLPEWACPVSIDDMKRLIAETRRLMPDVGIQVPPNLADWWPELVAAGATDLGGLSANGDHISPEHPFPSPHRVRQRLQADGVALTERLCVYPQLHRPRVDGPGVLDTIKVKYWSFIPRRGPDAPTRLQAAPRRSAQTSSPARPSGPATGCALSERGADGAVRRDAAGGDRGACAQAADELRAELAGETVTFVVNRNINVSNVCTVGCAFCGFGQGKRSPDAYEHDEQEFARRVREAVEFGATELCIQSGIHPDWSLEDYLGWLRFAKRTAAEAGATSTCTPTPRWRSRTCATSPACRRPRSSRACATPVSARRRAPPRRCCTTGCANGSAPNKLPVARWVEIIEASHAAGLRSTATVMFGHIEEPWELAEHMRVVRELQERTGGITEFVPLSFIPFQTLLGRTHGVEEISREENLKHTAVFRLALGRSVRSVQASWVKMGLDAATESLRWGVNDLGGTLMEESISRLAGSYHGTRLEPEQLVAAAHAAGRPAAERTTLYAIRRRYELPVAV